jgi:hypothetical protein
MDILLSGDGGVDVAENVVEFAVELLDFESDGENCGGLDELKSAPCGLRDSLNPRRWVLSV